MYYWLYLLLKRSVLIVRKGKKGKGANIFFSTWVAENKILREYISENKTRKLWNFVCIFSIRIIIVFWIGNEGFYFLNWILSIPSPTMNIMNSVTNQGLSKSKRSIIENTNYSLLKKLIFFFNIVYIEFFVQKEGPDPNSISSSITWLSFEYFIFIFGSIYTLDKTVHKTAYSVYV